ncbi:MAG: ribosome silencing factor [Deltaproteobacteria bacterium]|nr:ribosome silencing factor [Deltaproteobacteria bacterium]
MKIKTSKQLALVCAKMALDKKALNLMLLDVRAWQGLNDYILICSAQSSVQAQAIAEEIKRKLKEEGIYNLGVEGYPQGKWILLDYNEVVVHIFYEYVREFYDLESLWQDAPRVKIPKSYYGSYGKK